MQDVLENRGNMTSVPQRSGLMATIFREYWNHFGLLFSVIAPEFAPLSEVLLSGKFVGLFFANHLQITLQQAPIWAIAAMVTVYTLTNAVFAPIWALLTTHLYMERAGTQQNAASH